MTKDEVLKMTLEALEGADQIDCDMQAAITAIKKVLAQPKQEPVAWGVFEGNLHDMFFTEAEAVEMAQLKGTHAEVRPLYTTPPQRKPLTLGQKQRLWSSVGDKPTLKARVNAYGLAIEAAHGIKE